MVSPITDPALRNRCMGIAAAVGERLARPLSHASDFAGKERYPSFPRSGSPSFANGEVGVALLFAQLWRASGDNKWALACHRSLAQCADTLSRSPLSSPLSLAEGYPGIGIALEHINITLSQYRNFSQSVTTYTLQTLESRDSGGRHEGEDWRLDQYDLLYGASGQLLYLIGGHELNAKRRQLITRTSQLLIEELLRSKQASDAPFRVANDSDNNPFYTALWPESFTCIGMAHGVSGVLAALCAVRTEGLLVPGIDDAIQHAARWILETETCDDKQWYGWPSIYEPAYEVFPVHQMRPSWCHGASGIGCSLLLSYKVTGISEFEFVAERSLRYYLDDEAETGLTSSNLCHGYSSLLMAAVQYANHFRDSCWNRLVSRTAETIVSAADHDAPLLFADPDDLENQNSSGLLTGAAGIALALLAAADGSSSDWRKALGIY